MMGRRLAARNGAELDAITGWRRVLAWRHVRRRERAAARREVSRG